MVGLVLTTSTPLAWNLLTPPANAGAMPVPVVTATPVPVTEPVPQQDVAGPARDSVSAVDGASASDAERAAAPERQGGTDPVAGTVARRSADDTSAPVTRSARIGDLDVTPSMTPRRLQIPSLAVDAAIGAVGVENNGAMEVPDDVRDVGWYRHGPAPGAPGAAVIAGHVDSREQGPGAFFDLRRLGVGARVEVIDGNGDVQRYDVVARRTYDKAVLPSEDLFARSGPSQLVLITCGGDFDNTTGSYRDNVVIYAQPVPSSS